MNKAKLILLALVSVVLGLLLVMSACGKSRLQQDAVSRALSGIPDGDREALALFFQEVVYKENFGFTLFGDKPISLTGYFEPLPAGNYFQGHRNNLLRNGWATWKKYRTSFPTRNYLLIEEREGDDVHVITIINKDAVRKTIHEHLDLFRQVLGERFSPEEFITRVETEGEIFSLLQRHEGLYGILLGYGKTNACLYQRREELHFFDSNVPFSFSRAVPSAPFHSLEEEICFLKEAMVGVEENSRCCLIALPQFVGLKDHSETQHLRKKYRKIRAQMMRRLAAQEHLLEIIMRQVVRKNESF